MFRNLGKPNNSDAFANEAEKMQKKIEYKEELEKLGTFHELQFFPLNFPWTDKDTIVDVVHSTRIWEVEDPMVEYGLGISCTAYYNGIVSVWVCLASLVKQRAQLDPVKGPPRSPNLIIETPFASFSRGRDKAA
jgi:hypothetical protein